MRNDYLGQFNNVNTICIDNVLHKLFYKKTFFLKRFIAFCNKKVNRPDWIASIKGMDLTDYTFCEKCYKKN